MDRTRQTPICTRALAGMAGGAAGTLAMDSYMRAMKKLVPNSKPQKPRQHDVSLIGRQHEKDESSTAALGRIIYEGVTGERPNDETKRKLSYGVHWAYGMKMGGVYGALRGRKPDLDLLGGLAYGAGLWLLGDEGAVPLLGLAEGPKAHPARVHAQSLGAHLVYGMVTGAVTQLLRKAV